MFPFGVVLTLIGYSAVYVSVFRLDGDKRSVTEILQGGQKGLPSKQGNISKASQVVADDYSMGTSIIGNTYNYGSSIINDTFGFVKGLF